MAGENDGTVRLINLNKKQHLPESSPGRILRNEGKRKKGGKGHRHPEYGVRKGDGGEAEGGVWKIGMIANIRLPVQAEGHGDKDLCFFLFLQQYGQILSLIHI